MGGSIIGNAPTGPSGCRRGGPEGDLRDTDLGPPIHFKESAMKTYLRNKNKIETARLAALQEEFPGYRVYYETNVRPEGVQITCWAHSETAGKRSFYGMGSTFKIAFDRIVKEGNRS